ncbi:hypothetical protein A7K94_0200190 [Modestobacter sp. VKM Ac-2676]|nr:hypothetical protein A7K94_0200190 [Modestobacter sp. VKM Ac-2676]
MLIARSCTRLAESVTGSYVTSPLELGMASEGFVDVAIELRREGHDHRLVRRGPQACGVAVEVGFPE